MQILWVFLSLFIFLLKSSTQHGEWPHACLLFDMSPTVPGGLFIGGASLIAPGVIITAAHKVE